MEFKNKEAAVSAILTETKKWRGYLEKRSNSQLESFTANVGSNNYTIFAVDYCNFYGENLNVYQAQPWCAMYVSDIFAYVFGAALAEKMLYGHYAYCPYGVNHFKKNNAWHTSPKPGDVIFFASNGTASHTGIVTKVANGRVYTSEGNTSSASGVIANGGSVEEKSYSLGYSRILGYGRPNYDFAVNVHWAQKYKERLKATGYITDDAYWGAYDSPAKKSHVVALVDKITGGMWTSNESDPSVHWVQPHIISLCGKGIISDKTQWINNPDASISAALFLAVIDKATGGMTETYKGRVTDHWGRNNLDSLCDKGIITTPEAWVCFEGEVTRGNAMALLCKAFNL